ncbi:RecX family transcriptional regulator [Patescibacteria group bacterium]|nr:RecX family transcriptional regulator [Patescibacteria group bacterium]
MVQLEKSGYLDDAVYARSYLNSEVVRKGKPLLLIKQKLINK